ncbi:vacuolar protein sorting-associated protein 4A-like [Saccostrea echinata]|uniref:vacuolar protein sorting-associated protein 4A-like n=1 Tax=Saccostrea echinata TaxID=191078 RepID=UPI002A840DD2|nr:vacuolar protein sorting-associated protein 4A-like [Saccostrea echinata]
MLKKPDVSIEEVFIPINVKERIEKSIIFPLKSPKIQEGTENVGHVVLYGEPGTGKTHLVNAITTELSHVTCFSLSFYELKNDGVLRNLFLQARLRKPGLIFLDDVEVISVTETDEGKKIASEFLLQLQGSPNNSTEGVLIVGMTNKPWKLDPTVLNCFPVRIEIPLPADKERFDILKHQLKGIDIDLSDKELLEIVKRTHGFTGADIVVLVRDALLQPVRLIQRATHYVRVQETTANDRQVTEEKWAPCSSETPGAIAMTWSDLKEDQISLPKLKMDDLLKSLSTTHPSSDDEYHGAIAKFTKDYGN